MIITGYYVLYFLFIRWSPLLTGGKLLALALVICIYAILSYNHHSWTRIRVTYKNNPLKVNVKVIHDNLQVYDFRMGRESGRF